MATLVVAVGSNTSPEVLRRKFVDAGLDTADLGDRIVRVWVADLDVTHSAHVAPRGYIPAAPYRRPGARLATTAAWLEPAHLAALDSTEPNYHRMTVSSTSLSLRTDGLPPSTGSQLPATFCLYVSRHGVLGDSPDSLAPFGSQADVFGWLDRRLGLRLSTDSAATCAELAATDRATRLIESLRAARLVQDAGLTEVAEAR
ncbi:hypothetical protein GPOL_c26260 [Gordonia polyisoprenivorans VH2]|uniref:Uncharacterized protein n=1 Tax=Gordonia polyisoprenivorans (strain DSM 44266 / VH2) TaxID=1112204 RepID=H6MQV1_GORPV|nr:hypothetical protein [Gordonia polyisoprenivorans]AFA73648.1 hypothetical protein GPOL_c26260 [Gordonia polyisoprenivorans VH2]